MSTVESGGSGSPGEVSGGRRESSGSTASRASTSRDGRRRSKVSRACDQCRRKKIKCDFVEGLENNPDQSCTGCRKIGEKCCFDRVPLKRGPSKGYSRSSSQSKEKDRRGSQPGQGHHVTAASTPRGSKASIGCATAGSASEPRLSGVATTPTGNVSLPPLLQYLPGMNVPQNATLSGSPSLQQPFWKVPYHEYQYQRRPSLDSMASDASQKVVMSANNNGKQQVQQPMQSIGASRASTNPLPNQDQLRSQRYYPQSSQDSASEAGSDNRRGSSAIPPLLNPAIQLQQQQYPYSQFALAQQQQQQQQFQQMQQGSPQLNSAKSNAGLSNGSFESLNAPKGGQVNNSSSLGHVLERTDSVASEALSLNGSPNPYSQGIDSATSSPAQKKRKKSTRSNSSKKSKASSQTVAVSNSTLINYGQIADIQLIDTYYEYIHSRFPIIPVNKETLTNVILVVNTQPISELHELNNYILLWFRNSLELLIRVCLKDNESHDVLFQQSTFVSAINECFQKIVDIHPSFRDLESQIDEKVTIIYLVSFIILNYTLALVSYNNSFVLGMSVIIFNELKLWRKFVFGDWQNMTGYDKISLRLYFELNVFDSLQSCSFGVRKLMDLKLDDDTVKQLYYDDVTSETVSKDALEWSIDKKAERVLSIIDSMELGRFLSSLCNSRRSYLKQSLPVVENNSNNKTIPSLTRSFLSMKRQFTDELLNLPDSDGKLPEMTPDLITRLSNMVCDLTSTINDLLKMNLEENPTNCLELYYRDGSFKQTETKVASTSASSTSSVNSRAGAGTVSPFVIAIFKDLFNVVELIKNIPTSLIGCAMGTQAPDFNSQPLVLQLSQCMNNMLQITTYTNTLRPFKIFKHELSAQSKNKPHMSGPIWKQKIAASLPKLQKPITPQHIMMTQFIDIAWRLADTEELGWFN